MHIISAKRLREAGRLHPECDTQLRVWEKVVVGNRWTNADDVKNTFPMVSVLKNDRFCFNIKGNKYRIVVKVLFNSGQVLIRFIGTHAEYDKIDANTI